MGHSVFASILLVAAFAQQPSPVWVGVGFAVEESGLRVNLLPYGSPAGKAGVLRNDLIVGVDDQDFSADKEKEKEFRAAITRRMPGDEVTLHVIRDGLSNAIRVRVEERPIGIGAVKEYSPLKIPARAFPEEQLADALIDEFKIRESYRELREHLGKLSDRGDHFRLSRLAYIQDEPFQLRNLAGQALDQLSQMNPARTVRLAADWLDAPLGQPAAPAASILKRGLTFDEHLEQLVGLLTEVRTKREAAFGKLSADDRKHFEDHFGEVFMAVAGNVELELNQDTASVLELAQRVDYTRLFEAAELLSLVADDAYLDDLKSALKQAWDAAGRPEGTFINRESAVGKILVGGNGANWYSEDAAILLDLAGRDFYTNNAGAARGQSVPAALLIDFAGDDAYEATLSWSQGAAFMGHGLLIDRAGDDEYVSRAWSQGAAMLGTSLFIDEAGDDVYRTEEYSQGIAVWGIAVHMDYQGDDVYEAHLLSQGVGLPGGAGLLLDGKGNDRYYAKGKLPTGYGDSGIFDSWSQGSAIGFRGLQSGGLAVLFDGAGKDRYEAGNFSQGGGYYFGVGMLRDAGNENDVYVGSRYNQGFAAHQAAGFFEEMGGNDFYTVRHAVAQGISWDETVVAFIDHAGDDVYEGGESFSHGAAAHSGFCIFLDLGGKNRFVYAVPQGSAGPNYYHGGSSFSLFISADGKGTYTSKMKPSSIFHNGGDGLFVDLPNSIQNALNSKSWKRLL